LKRAIERYLVSSLARLLGTAQLRAGDLLLIDRHPGERELAFRREIDHRFITQGEVCGRKAGVLLELPIH